MAFAATRIAGAQERLLYVDVGTSRMSFADSIGATAFSISPVLRTTSPSGSFNAFGTFSRLAQSWSNSGTISATVNTARRGHFAGELEGIAAGSLHSDGTRTGQMLGNARLWMSGTSGGAWVGAGLGRTWDGTWRPVMQGEVGAWAASGDNSFSASLTPTQVEDTIRYADAVFAAQHQTQVWEFGAQLGVRAGDHLASLPASRSAWGSVGAVYWATPTMGLVASAGTYPVDLTQGYPGGDFVSLALRLRARAQTADSAPAEPLQRNEPGTLRVSQLSGDTRRVRVYAPGANTIEILGDFTQWEPVALQREGRGWWTGTVSIPAGTHEVNVRVDGRTWLVPPGLTTVRDEFGGSSGRLVIPE